MPTNPVAADAENTDKINISSKSSNQRPEITTPTISKFFIDALRVYVISKIEQTGHVSELEAKRLWANTVLSVKESRKSVSAVDFTYRDLGPLLALGNVTFYEAFYDIRKASETEGAAADPESGNLAARVRSKIEETKKEIQEIQSLIETNEAALAPWARENFTALTVDYWGDDRFLNKTPAVKIFLLLQQRLSSHAERRETLLALTTLHPSIELSLRDHHPKRSIPIEHIPDIALYLGFPLRLILNNDMNPEWVTIPVFSYNEDTDIAVDMYLRMPDKTRRFAKKLLERKAAMLSE